MRVVSRMRHNEEGAVLVWVTLMMVALISFGALAVDLGYGYVVKRDLSSTSDSASLAGAQAAAQEYAKHPGWSGCSAGIVSDVEDEARGAALDNVTANTPPGTYAATVDVSCEGDAIDVKVDMTTTVPAFLARVFGTNTMTPDATATAEVSGSPVYGGIRPFALCNDTFTVGAPQAGVNYQVVYPQSKPHPTATCGTTSGNFYLLQLDPHDSGTPYLEIWTEHGYPYQDDDPEITFPPGGTTIDGNTGANFNPLSAELDYLVDNEVTILLPVFDEFTGGGANANIHATGAVPVKLCGYSIHPHGDDPDRKNSGCWQEGKYDAAAAADPQAKFIFQFKYVEDYSTSYDGAGDLEACDLGPGCIPAIRLVK